MPKISVVIPAFDEEKFLPKCLESLKKQDFQDFEIIVVDNNSKDNTAKIAQSFGAKVLKEENQGVAFARQKGLFEAKGKIVVFSDADAIFPENWLSRIFEEFEKDKDLVAFGGSCEFYSGPFFVKLAAKFLLKPFLFLDKIFSGGENLMGCNMAAKKEVLMKIGGFDTRLKMNEDVEISYRLRKVGKVKLDPNFKVKVSGRRYRHGLILGILNYAPSTICRWIFKKFDCFQFFPVQRKEEYAFAYFSFFFGLFLILFFAFVLFFPSKTAFAKNLIKKEFSRIITVERELKSKAGTKIKNLKQKYEKNPPYFRRRT